ncbi:hypothetical protein EN943_10630 [Mesorhizobium sp. M7A.F.Ca.US.006.01.1.1]|uniref:hypothetical protein n=1 Tax=Mesorhizobium sp. M7A.F.Ca.US.006.01.1.1 TaxID=2496707 RepID=UPI000FC99E71|nr:hypothetical protein [Mesorhizobium sp. M7A.F.Ca.US.006.01.1.1]RUZ78463.1 hypothetical protein EN943_10630 [Mesorhizobium sp. M7A.F.Ca.US.006.01.1.1]
MPARIREIFPRLEAAGRSVLPIKQMRRLFLKGGLKMATQVTGAGGTTTSFSNTPQAKDDLFNCIKDTVVIASASQSMILGG